MSAPEFSLLGKRRFGPMFSVQFLGAFNDNLLKFAMLFLANFGIFAEQQGKAEVLAAVATGLFILPYFLFSALAGQIADLIDKARLVRWIKAAEVAIMALALAGFWVQSIPVLLACLFLMGLHSTLFGPVKYSILPQHLHENEIMGGTGLIEGGTFLAILGGQLLAGAIPAWEAGLACTVIALAGLALSFAIPPAPAIRSGEKIDWNLFKGTWEILGTAQNGRGVWLSILGISWFFASGAVLMSEFAPLVSGKLAAQQQVATLFLVVFSVAIALGSVLVNKLLDGEVSARYVPASALVLAGGLIDLWLATRGFSVRTHGANIHQFLATPGALHILVALAVIALSGGMFIVPLYAILQVQSPPEERSRIIAANNIVNALFMIAASLLAALMLGAGFSIPQLFLVTAVLNALVAVYIYTLVPEFLMRFLCWMLIHSVYRLRKTGLDNIPATGPAILTCNHVSFVDALVIAAASPRPIRFVMDHNIFKIPLLSFVFKTGRAIPIASAKEDIAMRDRAFDTAAQALKDGDLVGIFPEGRITDSGEMYPFRPGVMEILKRQPAPVVPMALCGLWGSFFSRKGGAAMTRPFRRGAFARVELKVAPEWAPQMVTPEGLQAVTLEMRGELK